MHARAAVLLLVPFLPTAAVSLLDCSNSSSTPTPGLDASGTDAAPPDAGSGDDDAGAVDANEDHHEAGRPGLPSDPGRVACGDSPCQIDAGDSCCTPPDAGGCKYLGICPGPREYCDEKADCPQDQTCCFTSFTNGAAALCQTAAACAGHTQACRTNAECGSGECTVVDCDVDSGAGPTKVTVTLQTCGGACP